MRTGCSFPSGWADGWPPPLAANACILCARPFPTGNSSTWRQKLSLTYRCVPSSALSTPTPRGCCVNSSTSYPLAVGYCCVRCSTTIPAPTPRLSAPLESHSVALDPPGRGPCGNCGTSSTSTSWVREPAEFETMRVLEHLSWFDLSMCRCRVQGGGIRQNGETGPAPAPSGYAWATA